MNNESDHNIQLKKVLPLSTGHIPEDIAKHHMDAVSFMTGDYGWLVLCRESENFEQRSITLTRNLIASGAALADVVAFVNAVRVGYTYGADYVLFDNAVTLIDEIPCFDW